ncbi:MAG TPA: lipopolysaccharide kinase InaA family protein [Thermoanaerobaculia bacterium]
MSQPLHSPRATDWVRIDHDARRTLCRPGIENELREIYDRHTWAYDGIASSPETVIFRGRRPVVSGLVGTSRVVVKRLHHGGVLASIGKDRFFTSRRVHSHIELADYLTSHGIATPRVEFASWRRINGLVRGEVGFELIEGAIDADACFFGQEARPVGWEARAAAIGSLVGRLHKIGFMHADLNLMNLLFTPVGELYVLDLDKTVLSDRLPTIRARMKNLERLERSIRKQGGQRSASFVAGIIEGVRGAYEGSIAGRRGSFRLLDGSLGQVDLG